MIRVYGEATVASYYYDIVFEMNGHRLDIPDATCSSWCAKMGAGLRWPISSRRSRREADSSPLDGSQKNQVQFLLQRIVFQSRLEGRRAGSA